MKRQKYWILIATSEPKVLSAELPIYWKRKVAIAAQRLYGGRVVACFVEYDPS